MINKNMPKRDAKGRFISTKNANIKKSPNKTENTTVESKQLINRFLICLDSSGSMSGFKDNAIKAFNQIAETIHLNANQKNQKSTISLITFGENSSVSEKFFNLNIQGNLNLLNKNNYKPDSGTPLFDAVGFGINKLLTLPDNLDTSYTVIVITDGDENCSSKFDSYSLNTLIQRVVATDRWTFAWLVPPGRTQKLIQQFKIPAGNVKEWETTAYGMDVAASQINTGIGNYFEARAGGKTATKGFFITDLSTVNSKIVKKQLDDIKDQVIIWTVPKEINIQPFVESAGFPYIKGRAYYQLTKDEIVQNNKEILLMEKGKTSVYAGNDARQLLNLPAYNVKVRPGNHANWDIFVQSTSTNRKLVRGTKLVYKK